MFHPSPELLAFERKLKNEPTPVQRPEPGFKVTFAFYLSEGAEVASAGFVHPTAAIHVGNVRLEDVGVRVVGIHHPWSVPDGQRSTHIPIEFFVSLPCDLVERVQQARGRQGTDQEVSVEIRTNLGIICQGDAGLVRPVYDNRIREEPLRFSRDQWLRLIERLGFTKILVVELPLQDDHTGNIGVAQGHLHTARSAFAHGNLDDVGPRAFKAFEALVPWAKGKRIFEAITKAYFTDADPEVAQTALEMLIKLAPLYHKGGRHLGSGLPVARHHARFLLVAAEAVVAWCAELGVAGNVQKPVRKARTTRAKAGVSSQPGGGQQGGGGQAPQGTTP